MTIYLIRPPRDDRQPSVDFSHPRNRGIDWRFLADVLDAKAPPARERLDAIDIYVRAAEPFESLWVGADLLVSGLLRGVLEPECKRDVEFLPVLVNGTRFYALLVLNTLDVLDRARSELKYFKSSLDRVKTIRRYAVKDVKTTEVFRIPEDPGSTFAAESVRLAYLDSGVPGLRFVDCEKPTT